MGWAPDSNGRGKALGRDQKGTWVFYSAGRERRPRRPSEGAAPTSRNPGKNPIQASIKTTRKAGARRPGRPVSGEGWPVLPIAVAGLLIATAIVLGVFAALNNPPKPGDPVNSVECNSTEQLAVHYHAHIAISFQGTDVPVPAQIGFGPNCLYWLHTHSTDGVVHIEAPSRASGRAFTLGDFFKVWGQPLSSTQVATLSVPSGGRVVIMVQGAKDKAPKAWTGAPADLPLHAHDSITIEILGSGQATPSPAPSPFTFTGGL